MNWNRVSPRISMCTKLENFLAQKTGKSCFFCHPKIDITIEISII